MVLVLLGALAMAIVVSHELADNIQSNVSIVVKVLPGATDAEIDRVQRLVGAHAGLERVSYSSPEKILSDESAIVGEDITEILDQNPFGGEFEAMVQKDYCVADSIEQIARQLSADPAVDEVVTQVKVVDSIHRVRNRVTAILLIVAAAMLIISFVLINNTVSLAVYSRRFIIHTMKLVGATGSFIRRPFLTAGLVTGLAAAALAIACLASLRAYGASYDPAVEDMLGWGRMAIIFGGMLLAGPAVCVTASAIATNRYLRSDYDDMFK